MFEDIWKLKKATTGRRSSWEENGRNRDSWNIPSKKSRIIADIKGSGKITHIWMTQGRDYREVLIKITWDNAQYPSVLVPLGDFFGLGHSIVNSYQSALFTASTNKNNQFNQGCALNCYVPMPFKERAVIELINESDHDHSQYFYIDYELYDEPTLLGEEMGYFHAEFHRENPFGGWGHEITVNKPEANIANKERLAWNNNYVILETKGRGHYVGCNYSVTNFQGTWWGEGDDMIWVDGYKWPPDLHGTGSEDYLNQAWGMQPNAFLHNGSSIYEENTDGYQTSYVYHLENPIRFEKEIKVTIEFGHGNHLRNEISTVAFWYASRPTQIKKPPSIEKRMPVMRKNGEWMFDEKNQITSREIIPNEEMLQMKRRWKGKNFPEFFAIDGLLSINEDQQICMNFQITDENPEIYEVPMIELMENLLENVIKIDIFDTEIIGTLLSNDEDQIILKEASGIEKTFLDLLKDKNGKKVHVEALLTLEDDQLSDFPTKYTIFFKKCE